MKTKILLLLSGVILTCYAINSNAQNTWYGIEAGISITTGTQNSAFGYNSQKQMETGTRNTSIGYQSLYLNQSGSYNTAVGAISLYYNTGSYNTATGNGALFWSTTASNNTANGAFSQYNQKTGYQNSAFGAYSLYYNTAGGFNTACGYKALYSNVSAYNTAIGWQSMYNSINSDASRNTAVGFNSLYYNSGNYNVAVGGSALYDNYGGTKNTAIGFSADVSTFNLDNATAIGYKAVVTSDNQIMLGNSSVTAVKTYGDIIWPSDERFKKNIKENVPGLDFIKQLRPVTYNYDIHSLNAHVKGNAQKENSDNDLSPSAVQKDEEAILKKEKKIYSGFLAQEVEVAANKLGYDFNGVYHPQNDKDVFGLGYADFVVPLVKAVQELSKQNDDLKARIEKLETLMNVQSQASLPSAKMGMIADAVIEQNIPNPFTSATTINYKLPQQYNIAKIVITDNAGRILKTMNISGSGKGSVQVDAASFISGTYKYSLYINGKLIETKQMVLSK